MASVAELRTGLAANLATITGLRTAAKVPDDPKPPVAIVLPQSVTYDNAFGAGMTTYNFSVLLLVSRVSERTGQDTLDSWVSSTGSNSIKLAIESDKTLGGTAYDVRVSEVRNYGEVTAGDVNYFSAEFIILCYAD
tara:strand:+ start:1900 stop:2307 length:408 start_codon:yes stop_codon:yes gene_type:complete